MKLVIILLLITSLNPKKVQLKEKKSYTNKRMHRNLYYNIKISDIERIISFDPFFMLLVGFARSALFEKYKNGMEKYSLKHSLNKSWLHFGYIDIRHFPLLEEKYQLKQFPVLLHFYEGELIKKDYRFNKILHPEIDLDIKFLHSVLEIHPSHEELKKLLNESLYTIIINLHHSEAKHFDVTNKTKVEVLKRISETVASLAREEF